MTNIVEITIVPIEEFDSSTHHELGAYTPISFMVNDTEHVMITKNNNAAKVELANYFHVDSLERGRVYIVSAPREVPLPQQIPWYSVSAFEARISNNYEGCVVSDVKKVPNTSIVGTYYSGQPNMSKPEVVYVDVGLYENLDSIEELDRFIPHTIWYVLSQDN